MAPTKAQKAIENVRRNMSGLDKSAAFALGRNLKDQKQRVIHTKHGEDLLLIIRNTLPESKPKKEVFRPYVYTGK